MENGIRIEVGQLQQLQLTPMLYQSLKILKMNQTELNELIQSQLNENPILVCKGNPCSQSACRHEGFNESIAKQASANLADDLKLQLHVAARNEKVIQIGEYIIDCIDERGYLTEDLGVIAEALKQDVKNVKKVMRLIQTFEPNGVCARSLAECLLIQLKQLKIENSYAEAIIKSYMAELSKDDISGICRKTGFSYEVVNDAANLIRKLNPFPGAEYTCGNTGYVFPEVIVSITAGKPEVELINDLPQLNLSSLYQKYLGEEDESTRQYIKNAISNAQQLIYGVERRYGTLLTIAQCILEHQKEFFLSGKPFLPLTLCEVAEELEVSISTVSRAICGKYLQFNGLVYAFKDFFPSKLRSGCSSAEAKLMILNILSREEKQKPLSDEQISKLLNEHGIQVARRTVAKYRKEFGALTASKRKNTQKRQETR